MKDREARVKQAINASPSVVFATAAENIAGTVEGKAVDPLGIREAFNCTGSAPIYACRAWVNFDGTTTTPTIRASGNVSSITDIGAGDYTVNYTTAMPDANYAIVLGSERNDATETGNICTQGRTTTTCGVSTFPYNSTTRDDNAHVSVAIFR